MGATNSIELMPISNEDELRLQVLLIQKPDALRINESNMTLYALVNNKEMYLQLHPIGRDDDYIKSIRQTLSSHILGSPSGYPLYIKRWTRMGQIHKGLNKLLMLAEPEAINAVIYAPNLNEKLARLAWWAAPNATNAYQMLTNNVIAHSDLAQELTQFLVDHLPFETQSIHISNTVSLLLKNNLIDSTVRDSLWKCGEQQVAYRIGFLLGAPDDIPLKCSKNNLDITLSTNNPIDQQLSLLFNANGQAYLITTALAIQSAINQDDLIQTFRNIENYFSSIQIDEKIHRSTTHIETSVREYLQTSQFQEQYFNIYTALLSLSLVNISILDPFFAASNAIGSVMRNQLKSQTTPVLQWIATLCAENNAKTITESGWERRRRRPQGQKLSRSQ